LKTKQCEKEKVTTLEIPLKKREVKTRLKNTKSNNASVMKQDDFKALKSD